MTITEVLPALWVMDDNGVRSLVWPRRSDRARAEQSDEDYIREKLEGAKHGD